MSAREARPPGRDGAEAYRGTHAGPRAPVSGQRKPHLTRRKKPRTRREVSAVSYVSLYRKWRPQTFADVTGQAHVVRTLTNALADKRIAHAYLFTGPRGTGKTTLARLLAKGLNCAQGPTPEPCNACPSCERITAGTAMDVVEIDGASNRGIDEMRDVRERVRFAPTEGPYKVYIIDEVHMLTNEAFNALLKVLEEPPKHVVFVFATTEPHKIPATVASRCQRFDFRRLSLAETVGRLAQVARAEGIDATEEALRLIARYAEGSLRDGLGLLDQCRAFADQITPDVVTGVLGVAPREQVIAFADVLAAADVGRGLALIKQLQETGRDLRQFLRDAARHLRDVLLFKVAGEGALGSTVMPGTDESEALRRQAEAMPVPLLLRAIETLGAAEADMRYAAQSHLPLEMAIVRLTRPEAQVDVGQLLARLEQLEQKVAALSAHGPLPGPGPDGVEVPGQAASPTPARGADHGPLPWEQPPAGMPPPQESQPTGPIGPVPQAPLARQAEASPRRGAAGPPEAVPAGSPPAGPGQEDAVARAKDGPGSGGDLSDVVAKWDRLHEILREQRHVAVQAFLREGRPVAYEGGVVTIAFPPDRSFHRDNLQSDQNRKVVEQILGRLLGSRIKVTTVLSDAEELAGKGSIPPGGVPPSRRPGGRSQGSDSRQSGARQGSATRPSGASQERDDRPGASQGRDDRPSSAVPADSGSGREGGVNRADGVDQADGADAVNEGSEVSEVDEVNKDGRGDAPGDAKSAGDRADGVDGVDGTDDLDDVVNHPAVQEALRLFGGRIIHVERNRR